MNAGCCSVRRKRRIAAWACALVAALPALPAHGRDAPGKADPLETRVGLASYYARSLHGQETASGETFDRNAMVAAHARYPFGTRVRVTNPENGRATEVRINDRGPTRQNRKEGVIIDLSPAAAAKLGMIEDGRSRVKVEVLEWGGDDRK